MIDVTLCLWQHCAVCSLHHSPQNPHLRGTRQLVKSGKR